MSFIEVTTYPNTRKFLINLNHVIRIEQTNNPLNKDGAFLFQQGDKAVEVTESYTTFRNMIGSAVG